ncbi:MAG TPA: aminotransferase class V-fold PLP-dependent enzyme, partial [Capillimicrobium sp.]
MDASTLRAAFPVLRRTAYLNAGTCGPIAQAAVDASQAELDAMLADGRGGGPFFERLMGLQERQRAAYAERVGAARPEDVALTTATSDGMARVLAGLALERGDEIVTSDEEHPGLLGPLAALRAARGVEVRAVPL